MNEYLKLDCWFMDRVDIQLIQGRECGLTAIGLYLAIVTQSSYNGGVLDGILDFPYNAMYIPITSKRS